jgi:hypothetical protein
MLYQPLLSHFKPSPLKQQAISLPYFIDLLYQEEEYWKGEQYNTKTMISHLRKIFYDIYGWNTQLIRGAAKIPGRYEVKLVPEQNAQYPQKTSGGIRHKRKNNDVEHLRREVLVKKGDWLNPNWGTIPEIYANNNQEVILPDQWLCDMGHVLAGMDAANYSEPVSPLPSWLMWLRKLGPSVDKNTDCATWLGDLSSNAGEFLFETLKYKSPLSNLQKQAIIEAFSPGADMLGNIDSIVIPSVINLNTHHGIRVTDIFKAYYFPDGSHFEKMQHRFSIFCQLCGLKNWNGNHFSNEKKWLLHQTKQLRNTTAFYTYTRHDKPESILIALSTWLGFNNSSLDLELLLKLFLAALKEQIKNEP